jgi:hypothetical protein
MVVETLKRGERSAFSDLVVLTYTVLVAGISSADGGVDCRRVVG